MSPRCEAYNAWVAETNKRDFKSVSERWWFNVVILSYTLVCVFDSIILYDISDIFFLCLPLLDVKDS